MGTVIDITLSEAELHVWASIRGRCLCSRRRARRACAGHAPSNEVGTRVGPRSVEPACGMNGAPSLDGREPVHVTWRLVRGLPSLRSPRMMRVIRAAFIAGKKGPKELGTFRLVHFSVQKNHVHLVCEADGAGALSRGLQGLAVRFARGLNRALGRRGKVLGDRYHSRGLQTPREVRWALGYVLCNARKHNAELLYPKALPRRWLDGCSSAAFFPGWRDYDHATEPDDTSPVVSPRTWLLRVGWNKHGRLPIDHLPRPRSEHP